MNAKELLLQHATAHFAQKGFDGVSLREISRDAGVNTASVHYHFSGKEDVYKKVITRYLSKLNAEREENLSKIDQSLPPKERLRALIKGYIAPHLMLCAHPEDHAYVRLLARFVVEDDSVTASIYKEQLTDVRNAYVSEIKSCVPAMHEDTMMRTFSSIVMLMICAPFDGIYTAISGKDAWPENPETLIEHVVNMASACFFTE